MTMRNIRKATRRAEEVALILECVAAFTLMIVFASFDESGNTMAWYILFVIGGLASIFAMFCEKRKSSLRKEYARLLKVKEKQRKGSKLLTKADGFADESTDDTYTFAIKNCSRKYVNVVKATNLDEAVGILLENNPEISFRNVSVVTTAKEAA